jgi:hypothetical protein
VNEYIKFSCERVAAEITSFDGLAELNAHRRKLLQLGLIGVDPNGIGLGNMSVRDGVTANFYITGSATGGIHELTLADCAKVVACDFERNCVQYEASVLPSSESLTHAAIYESDVTAGSGHSLSRLQAVGRSFERSANNFEGLLSTERPSSHMK